MLLTFLGPRTPGKGERLLGIPFLDWIGKRFLKPAFPSCDLGNTPAETLLGSIRAANFYFAAAASEITSAQDPRSEEKRQSQVMSYMSRARSLSPKADLPLDALGQ